MSSRAAAVLRQAQLVTQRAGDEAVARGDDLGSSDDEEVTLCAFGAGLPRTVFVALSPDGAAVTIGSLW